MNCWKSEERTYCEGGGRKGKMEREKEKFWDYSFNYCESIRF